MYKVLKDCYTCYKLFFITWRFGDLKTAYKKIISLAARCVGGFFSCLRTARRALLPYDGDVNAYAVVLLDADSGKVLFEKCRREDRACQHHKSHDVCAGA